MARRVIRRQRGQAAMGHRYQRARSGRGELDFDFGDFMGGKIGVARIHGDQGIRAASAAQSSGTAAC